MQPVGIHDLELILLFLVIVVATLTAIARRFQTPYPIVLVIGGVILSLFPHLPRISLNPEVIFLVILPPLVYAGGFNTSWRDFRYNLLTILMLAFGLVGATVLGVSLGAGWLLPGFDYRTGAVLGAVVAATDAIAAGAIARRLGLPHRVTELLEGESLVNDASGLVALQFAVALVTSGERPTMGLAILQLCWLISGGIAVGLAVAWILHKVSLRITDPPVEITLTLVTPYLAYLGAESIDASGVLAAVVCGLYLGRKRSEILSIHARLENSAVWNTLEFLLNGIVFILIGLQLRFILADIRNESIGQLFVVGTLFVVFVVALRLIWIFPGAWISYLLRTRLLHQPEMRPKAKEVFLLGWTGMRGVLALAAAVSLPTTVESGAPFPQRNIIIFLTFCVIIATLVVQGLTLPMVIRKLGLAGAKTRHPEEQEARRLILNTVLDYLGKLQAAGRPEHAEIYEDFLRHYRDRLTLVEAGEEKRQPKKELAAARYYRNLAQELRVLERTTALRLRDENGLNDEVLRAIERELDLIEARYARS